MNREAGPKNTANEPVHLRQKYAANLEVSPEADFEEIKSSYRTLMKRYHPDLHGADPEKKKVAEQLTAQLNEAFRFFEEEEKKKQ